MTLLKNKNPVPLLATAIFISLIVAGWLWLPQEQSAQLSTSSPKSANQESVPSMPGANLFISVVDEQGQTVEEGTIEVSVEFEGDAAYYDYSYSVSLASIPDGLLGIHPPPSSHLATMSLQVVTLDGKTSDTLVIRNDEYWEAVTAAKSDFVATHEFDLGKTGEATKLP